MGGILAVRPSEFSVGGLEDLALSVCVCAASTMYTCLCSRAEPSPSNAFAVYLVRRTSSQIMSLCIGRPARVGGRTALY